MSGRKEKEAARQAVRAAYGTIDHTELTVVADRYVPKLLVQVEALQTALLMLHDLIQRESE